MADVINYAESLGSFIQCECHVYNTRVEMQSVCQMYNVQFTMYSTLPASPPLLSCASRTMRTAAEILLSLGGLGDRWSDEMELLTR